MTLLLDTHAFLWGIGAFPRLSAHAVALMKREAGNELVLSVVSLWEIALKLRAGKLDLPPDLAFLDTHMGILNVRRVLSISPAHVFATLKLPAVHKDPFDRLLAAQCVVERMQLVSADRVFKKYPIEVVW